MSGHQNQWMPHGLYPEGVDWNTDLGSGTLLSLLNDSVAKYGNRPCLSHMGYRLTYNEFGAMVDKAARGLVESGTRPGDRVGMFMPNTPYFPIMFFAILKAGATVVNFSSTYSESPNKLAAQIRDSGTTTMVTMDLKPFLSVTRGMIGAGQLNNIIACPMKDVLPTVKSVAFRLMPVVREMVGDAKLKAIVEDQTRDKNSKLKAISAMLLKSERTEPINSGNDNVTSFVDLLKQGNHFTDPLPSIAPDNLAILQYTGGTTGLPKGATLSHFNLVANARQINAMYGTRPGRPDSPNLLRPGQEKFLTTMPFFHIYGLTVGLFTPLSIGAEIEVLPDPRDIKKTLQTIQDSKPSVFPAVPRILHAITENKSLSDYDLGSVRIVISGGAALPSNVRKAFETATGCKILQGYGLSETSPVVTGNPPTGPNKPESIGLPMPGTEIRIVDINDGFSEVAHGTDGEICIRGPQVMSGYWNKPGETAEVMDKDGWFHTGDIGHFDEDGYIHITDRLKRMASINGLKYYPNVIENAICLHPAVAECVVIRVNKGDLSESLKAIIRFRDGVTDAPDAATLAGFLKNHLTEKEVPRAFEFRKEELPKTAVMKPDWNRLEEEEAAKANPPPPPEPHL